MMNSLTKGAKIILSHSPGSTISPQSSPVREEIGPDQRRFSKWLSLQKVESPQIQPLDPKQQRTSFCGELGKYKKLEQKQKQLFVLENKSYYLINSLSFLTQCLYALTQSDIHLVIVRLMVGFFMCALNIFALLFHLSLLPAIEEELTKEVNQSGEIQKQIVYNHYKNNKRIKIFYIVIIIVNIIISTEFEFQKYLLNDSGQSSQTLTLSLAIKESAIEKGYLQYITIYSLCFLYTLFLIQKQITFLNNAAILILQVSGISYYVTRYFTAEDMFNYWELIYFLFILLSKLHRKSFWDYFTGSSIERRITGHLKHGIVKNIKSFYNNVFELLPQGIAIIDSEKDLIFNNSGIKELLECKSADIVKQIQGIVLKKKESRDDSYSIINLQSNIVNNIQDAAVNIKKTPSAPDCSHIHETLSNIQGIKQSNIENLETLHQIPTAMKQKMERSIFSSNKNSMHKIKRIGRNNGSIQQSALDASQYENLEQVINELLQFGQRNRYRKNILKKLNTVWQDSKIHEPQSLLIEGDQQNIQFSDDSVTIQYTKNKRHLLLKLDATRRSNPSSIDFSEPVLLVILEDITDQVIKKELELITKFRMKMLTSISHELKTPLNFSINTLQNLSGQVEQHVYDAEISPALACNKYLFHIFNDILDYSSIEAKKFQYKFEHFSLKNILKDCQEIVDFQSKFKSIELVFEYDEKIAERIFSDPSRIKQIVLNLLSNAIKFTQCGSVTLRAKQIEDNQIEISVEDTGIGISKENQQIIFNLCGKIDYLQQSDKYQVNTQGIGLGLSVSSQIVKGLSSRSRKIHLESEVDKGSKFTFYIENYVGTGVPQMNNSSVPFLHSQQQVIVQNIDEEIEINCLPQSIPFKSNYRLSTKCLDKLDFNYLSSPKLKSNIIVDSCDISRQQSAADLDIQLPQQSFNPKLREINQEDEMYISVDRVIGQQTKDYDNMRSPFSIAFGGCDNTMQMQKLLLNDISCPDTSNIQMNQSNISLLDQSKIQCKCVPFLSIDDNEFNLQILKNLIKKLGFECDVALSGQIGIDKIVQRYNTNKCCPHYQMIFCDIDMPVKNGYETTIDILTFYKKIKLKQSKIPPITACTALNFPDFQTKCIETGMKYFLPKPVDIQLLKEIISKVHQ